MSSYERPRISRKWQIAITVYAIIFFAVLLIANLNTVNLWLGKLLSLLAPLLTGLVIAYLANPFFRFFERRFLIRMRSSTVRRIISLILTYLVLIGIIMGLIFLIIPQLISTVRTFAQNFHTHMDSVVETLNGFISTLNQRLPAHEDGSPAIAILDKDVVYTRISTLWNDLAAWVMASINPENLSFLKDLLSHATQVFVDVFLGVFISIYLLASKEKRQAQINKLRRAYLSERLNRRITSVISIADSSFGGFLRGKLLDSCIVGVLVYVACLIFRMPYGILVAVIVGITDIIPVIGPFIGVIPTAVIILLTDPMKVIPYLLCILVIQQIDGNIIAPKILGENTGVSSLCVLISILVMGDLMGLVGMVIGVPLFATLIELGKIFLDKRLNEKGLSGDLDTYYAEDIRSMVTEETPPEEEPLEPAPPRSSNNGSGYGNLSESELTRLRTYALAKKHHIFTDPSEEALSIFAADVAALSPKEPADSEPIPQGGEEA